MKRMFLKAMILTVVSGLIAACSLDIESPSIPTAKKMLVTADDLFPVMNGIIETNNSIYCNNWMCVMIGMPDMFGGNRANINAIQTKVEIRTNDGQIGGTWNNAYSCIYEATSLIADIENVNMSDDMRKMFLGQCYFIRGYTYLMLTRLWGKIPIKNEALTSTSDFFSPRASYEDIYKAILQDFEDAKLNLPVRQELNMMANENDLQGNKRDFMNIYVCKDAAYAGTALASLCYANVLSLEGDVGVAATYYQDAVHYADSTILGPDYTLYEGPFADLYDYHKRNDTSCEVMFRATYIGDNTNNGFIWAGCLIPNSVLPVITSMGGNSQAKLQAWYVDQFYSDDSFYNRNIALRNDPTRCDPRYSADFLTRWVGTLPANRYGRTAITFPEPGGQDYNTSTQQNEANVIDRHNGYMRGFPYLGLYRDPDGGDNASRLSGDLPLLRLGEIYLVKAEAMNELGGYTPEQIFEPVNTLRARARRGVSGGTLPLDMTPATLDNYRAALPPAGLGTPNGSAPNIPEPDLKYAIRRIILKERDIELAGELRRYYDLTRMMYKDGRTLYEYLFADFYPSQPSDQFVSDNGFSLDAVNSGPNNDPTSATGTATWGPVRYYPDYLLVRLENGLPTPSIDKNNVKKYTKLPIPFSEIQYNTAMEGDQNWGW